MRSEFLIEIERQKKFKQSIERFKALKKLEGLMSIAVPPEIQQFYEKELLRRVLPDLKFKKFVEGDRWKALPARGKRVKFRRYTNLPLSFKPRGKHNKVPHESDLRPEWRPDYTSRSSMYKLVQPLQRLENERRSRIIQKMERKHVRHNSDKR